MNDSYGDEQFGNHVAERRSGVFMGSIEALYDFFGLALSTIGRESALFIGVALTLVGTLSFESGKYCDGNTADYLSCTRPSTFYFYSPLDITIIVIGAFLILVWVLNRRHHH